MAIRWQTMLVAFLLAVATWYLVTGREKVETWLPLPVEMTNSPEGLVIQKGMVKRIEVRVRGPKGMISTLDFKKLAYPLDVSSLKVGENLIDLDARKVPLSRAYEVVQIKPDRLILTVDREAVKTVPVHIEWTGAPKLHRDMQVDDLRSDPEFVQLHGPASELRKLDVAEVRMDTVFEDDTARTWTEDLPILLPDSVKAQPGLVRVSLELGPKTQRIVVKIRSIEAEPPRGLTVEVADNLVTLEIEGPVALFRNDQFRREIAAYPKIEPGMKPGNHELEYWVSLPQGCRLVGKKPETLSAVVRRVE
ncbi:YbbR-like protein [Paucidesulfovibrio gracilis DSM 16080]|uniref:YbbR-like protein n=1 Tax=Paucidesulfovibrio gracilis DSM 16080 TaxID=1121449 RepID=A0A1T4WMC0_9BACT|nr:CdaR family protein [Paucidesulfovibrio gracilis]SKA78018.1 YbbR-like protein [Paucidesulfovibrio gracilis DSM 16080]